MNELLLKQIALLSAIAGGVLGLLSIIPFIKVFSITILVICLATVILVYMKRKNLIGIFDLKEGAIFGAIIGFVSFLAAAAVYIPLDLILGLIFKGFILKFFLTDFGSFMVMLMLTGFIALLSALMNGFAGLSTAYIYELLSGLKKEDNENINFEIK